MTRVRGIEQIARYVGKLGLELVNDLGKKAKGKSVTPWQLLEEVATLRERAKSSKGDERRDANKAAARRARTWRTWVDGMKGARWITWSVGLRELAGLGPERSDEQLVADAEEAEAKASAIKARIPGELRKPVLYNRRLVDVLIDAADRGLPLGPFVAEALGAEQAAVWDSVNEPERLAEWARQRTAPKPPKAGQLTQSSG